MDSFTQWCLVCERKLNHDAVYCSIECLKTDFVSSGTFILPPSSPVSASSCAASSTTRAPPSPTNCPPSPTPSHGSFSDMSSSWSSSYSSSSSSNGSPERSQMSRHEATQAILNPPFSLEFKSRRPRRI